MKSEVLKNKRIVYYDILNIIAIVAVIALHCNGIVHNYSVENQQSWAISLIVECVCFFAVPIFIMLSGANLMKYRERYTTKEFFRKRLLKVLIPFIFWAIIMGIWKVYIGVLKIDNYSIKEILNIFFQNKEEPIYYFMFDILGIYLTIPALSILAEEKNRKLCWYVVITMFITQSFLPIFLKLFDISYANSFSIQFGGLLIFVLLGYLISTQEIRKKHRIIIYCLGIVSIIIRYLYTYYQTTTLQVLDTTLFDYLGFYSVLPVCAVFIFVKYSKICNNISNVKIKNVLCKMASCSFGIYLIHIIIMEYEKKLFNLNDFSIIWRTFGIISTYLISLAIVYFVKKYLY